MLIIIVMSTVDGDEGSANAFRIVDDGMRTPLGSSFRGDGYEQAKEEEDGKQDDDGLGDHTKWEGKNSDEKPESGALQGFEVSIVTLDVNLHIPNRKTNDEDTHE